MRIKVDEDLPRAAVRTMSLNRLRGQRLWSPPWHSCSSCSKLKSGDLALARLGRILVEDHFPFHGQAGKPSALPRTFTAWTRH